MKLVHKKHFTDINPPDMNVYGSQENILICQNKKIRDEICKLEASLKGLEGAVDETNSEDLCPLKHHFAPGNYGREMFLPAGSAVVGKIHKHAHLNFIMKGKVRVTTEAGMDEYAAPCIFTSYAGTKRAVFVIEDTIWVTVHPTDKSDPIEIEKDVIADSYMSFDAFLLEKE